MTAAEVAERAREARARLAKAKRHAHPDMGERAGAEADASFWARLRSLLASKEAT